MRLHLDVVVILGGISSGGTCVADQEEKSAVRMGGRWWGGVRYVKHCLRVGIAVLMFAPAVNCKRDVNSACLNDVGQT